MLDDQFTEMDRIAESWIGSDLSRWEWYERLRSRRSKFITQAEKETVQFNEDMEQLRRSLMEIDAALGTGFLDENNHITMMGWLFLFALTSLYIAVGYAIVHGFVMAFMGYVHTTSFP